MKYTLVIAGKHDQELLDRGLPYEKFLFGPKNASAPLELQAFMPELNTQSCIAGLELVHIHAARDHLVLTNPSILEVTPEESDALYDSVKDILAEITPTIHRPTPGKWFIEAEQFATLSTVHIQQAEGRNIDFWMPQDTDIAGVARQWRKWQNDIQMIWFDHPVNRARQANELLSINSLWISGIGSLNDIKAHPVTNLANQFHGSYVSLLAHHLNKPLLTKINTANLKGTLSLLSEDDAQTQFTWEAAKQALAAGHIDLIEVIHFPNGVEQTLQLRREDLPKKGWAFWKKPHPVKLEDILGSHD
jgi:hypothetical protein